MRAEAEFTGINYRPPVEPRARLLAAIDSGLHPYVLRDCGVCAELLAYCGITIERLVERPRPTGFGITSVSREELQRYPLEHLIAAFQLTLDDLCLLGFGLPLLRKKYYYPLIVLYDMCALRADSLFRFEIGYPDLQNFLLDVDARYAPLLQLNLPWWQRALSRLSV